MVATTTSLLKQRTWLGEVFKVGGVEPGSPGYEIAKAKRAYERLANMKRQMEFVEIAKTSDPGNAGKMWSEIEAHVSSNQYEEALKKLATLQETAKKIVDDKQKELTKKFGEFKAARVFARNVIASAGQEDAPPCAGSTLEVAKEIETLEQEAVAARELMNFEEAKDKLDLGIGKYNTLKESIEKAKKEVEKETKEAADSESYAFELYGTSDKAMRSLVGDSELLAVLAGGGDLSGGKSPALKEMEKAFGAALIRYDKLKSQGLNPPDAADVALKNIPRAFWPDRAIREIDMFLRIERQIELDEANQEATDIFDSLIETETNVLDVETFFVSTVPDEVSTQLENVMKMKLGLKMSDDLPDIGSEEFNALSKSQQKALEWQSGISDFTDVTSAVTGGLGVIFKAADAIKKSKDASGEFEGPVQKKIAEFERNKAIFDAVWEAKNYGLGLLEDVCPALGVASSAADALKSIIEAVKYFKMLADINRLGEKAERDPKSVVYLPLMRMAKVERLKAAEAVLEFVTSALEVAGKAGEMGGISAPAGIAIDVAGKIIAQGGKFVFSNIKWSDAKKAKGALLKAKGPPIDREMVAIVFKFSNKYATYCLAIAAVEDNDPWAVKYCLLQGLNEGEVSDPATSVMVLRKYMMLQADIEDDQETFSDTFVGKKFQQYKDNLFALGDMLEDALCGRDTSVPYEPAQVLDPQSGEMVPNENYWVPVPPTVLSADEWRTTIRTEALSHGWFDDRSSWEGCMDTFSQHYSPWLSLQQGKKLQPTKEDCEKTLAVREAARELSSALRNYNPVANDRATPHEGVQSYVLGLMILADDVYDEIDEEYQRLLDGYQFPGGAEEKENFLLEAVKKNQEELDKARQAADKKLRELIANQKWESPFGKCTLADFAGLATTKLGIDDVILYGQLDVAANELNDVLFEEASRWLRAATAETMDGMYITVRDAMLLKNAYNSLAVLALGVRSKFLGTTTTWDSSKFPIGLDPAIWEAAEEKAKESGLSGGSRAVRKAFESAYTKYTKFQSSGVSLQAAEVQDALRVLEKELKAFAPVDADNLPFDPMQQYIRRVLTSLIPIISKKVDEGPPGAWKPASFEPTEKNWNDVKKVAVENGLKNATTGIGGVLKKLDTARGDYAKEGTEEVLLEYLNAIDKAVEKVLAFKPITEKKETHPGGTELKRLALKSLKKEREEQSAKSTWKMPAPELDVKKWDAHKKQAIAHGLHSVSTGIGKALKKMLSAQASFEKLSNETKPNEKKKQSAQVSFAQESYNLLKAIRAFAPKDAFNEKFEPMADYLSKFAGLVSAIRVKHDFQEPEPTEGEK